LRLCSWSASVEIEETELSMPALLLGPCRAFVEQRFQNVFVAVVVAGRSSFAKDQRNSLSSLVSECLIKVKGKQISVLAWPNGCNLSAPGNKFCCSASTWLNATYGCRTPRGGKKAGLK
jgi:hypothetical protein